jgi:hypothetical protein
MSEASIKEFERTISSLWIKQGSWQLYLLGTSKCTLLLHSCHPEQENSSKREARKI